jgi:photosystem II stability/assembly factor-like uncharacterized protein
MKAWNGKTIFLWVLALCVSLASCSLPSAQPTASPTIPTITLPPLPTDTIEPTITPTPTETPIPVTPLPHMQTGAQVTISQIRMFTPEQGWALGGESDPGANVLVTLDGGHTWMDVTPPEAIPAEGQSQKAAYATFLDVNTAWVVYYFQSYMDSPEPAVVWRTTDGGSTWQSAVLPVLSETEFFAPSNFNFADIDHGWLMVSVGAGMSHDYTVLYRTVDGGQDWEIILDPYQDNPFQICSKTDMQFADASNGWVTRDCLGLVEGGQLFRTVDGGSTWKAVELDPPKGDLQLLAFPNTCGAHSLKLYGPDGVMFALDCLIEDNDETHERSYTYWSNDAGKNWSAKASPGGELVMFSATQGYLLGRKIYSTEDRGGDWVQVKSVNWDGQFSFVAPRLGWAVAHNDKNIALVFTENYGETWREIKPVIAE